MREVDTESQEASRISWAERITVDLHNAIMRGELLPGEQIRQSEWARRLGVSLIPLREALKVLTTQYILRHDPMRGYFVTKLDNAQIEQLYRIRILVETEVLQSLEWLSPEVVREIEADANEWIDLEASGDAMAADEKLRKHLFLLWDHSPLDIFVREAKRLWHLTDPYRLARAAIMRDVDPGLVALRARTAEMIRAIEEHDRDALIHTMVESRSTVAYAVTQLYGSSRLRDFPADVEDHRSLTPELKNTAP
jgi:DNA-binding GntR family transcriptional regulator